MQYATSRPASVNEAIVQAAPKSASSGCAATTRTRSASPRTVVTVTNPNGGDRLPSASAAHGPAASPTDPDIWAGDGFRPGLVGGRGGGLLTGQRAARRRRGRPQQDATRTRGHIWSPLLGGRCGLAVGSVAGRVAVTTAIATKLGLGRPAGAERLGRSRRPAGRSDGVRSRMGCGHHHFGYQP